MVFPFLSAFLWFEQARWFETQSRNEEWLEPSLLSIFWSLWLGIKSFVLIISRVFPLILVGQSLKEVNAHPHGNADPIPNTLLQFWRWNKMANLSPEWWTTKWMVRVKISIEWFYHVQCDFLKGSWALCDFKYVFKILALDFERFSLSKSNTIVSTNWKTLPSLARNTTKYLKFLMLLLFAIVRCKGMWFLGIANLNLVRL